MTSSSYDNIASPNRGSTGFQTHLERRFTPGRFGGIGYTAGLEIWAANTKSVAQPQDGYFAHMEKCVG